MTQTIKNANMTPETGKVISLDEYKRLTGDEQLQQIIQSAVAGALGQMHLDNPIPDPPNAEESTMTTIDTKMKRCCIPTEFGNTWVQGRTIPQMCQAFHEKLPELKKIFIFWNGRTCFCWQSCSTRVSGAVKCWAFAGRTSTLSTS